MTIAVSTTTLRHHVRLVHASTGAVLGPVSGRLVDPVPGWVARPGGAGIVVTSRLGPPEPTATPRLAVTLEPAWWGEVLDLPPVADQPPRTVVVDLDVEEIDVEVQPLPMRLVVHLAVPATGEPQEDKTVTVRATTGSSTIDLPETAAGVYTSAAVPWTAAFTPCELLVDGELLRTVSMDFTTSTTSVRLVDVT